MMVKETNYKSPRHKLTKFFEKSRDKWKEKCLKAKSKGKQLSNRVRFLEKSKENLKIKIESLQEELAKLKSQDKTNNIEKQNQKKTVPRKQ
jgi:ribosomal protein L29